MGADEINAWAAFFGQINAARWWVLLGVVVLAVGAALAFFGYIKFRRDERRELERGKSVRSTAYAESFDALQKTVSDLAHSVTKLTLSLAAGVASTERITNHNTSAVAHLAENINKMAQRLTALINRVDGRMSVRDSCRFIHHAFEHDLYREICLVVASALRNNDYANRKPHVTRKVLTAIGDAMTEARLYLTSYLLAIDPAEYFAVDSTAVGERFLLVDQVWRAVEPKFDHAGGTLDHRIEEANLLVENTIRDYVVSRYGHVTRNHSPEPESSRSSKTPLPETAGGSLPDMFDSTFAASSPTSSLQRRSGESE